MILTIIIRSHIIKAMEESVSVSKEDGITPEAEDTRFSVNARQALSTSIFWRMWLSQVIIALHIKLPRKV